MSAPAYYTMRKKDLQKFLDGIAERTTLLAPAKAGKDYNFTETPPGKALELAGYVNTARPPREHFLPERERILEYSGRAVRESAGKKKAALFGIRPCDVHGLMVLDKVMEGHGYVDVHYARRREGTLIMALACSSAGDNCFCGSMGTCDLHEGFDLLFAEAGDRYHVTVGSGRGRELVSAGRALFSKTAGKPPGKRLRFKKRIDTENLPDIIGKSAASPVWDDTEKLCLSCASCTFSCPTCFCHNIVHEADIGKASGKVVREMDYCMLLRFTRVAGGAVTREPRRERVRQFFSHKLAYGKINEGLFHCVGCGRCITECMAGIDITDVAQKLREDYEKKR